MLTSWWGVNRRQSAPSRLSLETALEPSSWRNFLPSHADWAVPLIVASWRKAAHCAGPSFAVGASPSAVQTSFVNLQHSGHFVQAILLLCSVFLPESLDAQTMTDGIVWLIASLAG